MQNMMQQSDGTALPMAGGAGGDVVNQMFAGTISRAVMSDEKMGLTDLLLRSMQKKQQQATRRRAGRCDRPRQRRPGRRRRPAMAFPLAPYWQGNGMRPLAAAIAQGGISPGTGAAAGADDAYEPEAARPRSAPAPQPPSRERRPSRTFQSNAGPRVGRRFAG